MLRNSPHFLLVAGAFLCLTVPAVSQDRPGPGTGPGMMSGRGGGPMMGPGMMGGGMGMMGGRGGMMMGGCPGMGQAGESYVEGRLAFLRAELRVTDAQQAVWNDYAEALKANLAGMQGMREAMRKVFETESPVERLDAHLAMMESRMQALKAIQGPLRALYASLDADQKRRADDLLTGMGCMM